MNDAQAEEHEAECRSAALAAIAEAKARFQRRPVLWAIAEARLVISEATVTPGKPGVARQSAENKE